MLKRQIIVITAGDILQFLQSFTIAVLAGLALRHL